MELGLQTKVRQMTGPHVLSVVGVHVIDSTVHDCDQVDYNRCNEDVDPDLDDHHENCEVHYECERS